MKTLEQLRLEAADLVEWVTGADGDVDMGTLETSSQQLAYEAARASFVRFPATVSMLPALVALDFADALLDVHHAVTLADRFPRLPGAQEVIRAYSTY